MTAKFVVVQKTLKKTFKSGEVAIMLANGGGGAGDAKLQRQPFLVFCKNQKGKL
jgi:hypothetical protein